MARTKKDRSKKDPWDNYYDEASPVHPELGPQHPMVVFNNHTLSAGKMTQVRLMPGPHMHSQIEINLILEGEITYWMDGKKIIFQSNTLNIFWGMVPHQVAHVAEPTHFIVIYVPIQMFLSLPYLSGFRDSIMAGAVVRAEKIYPFDRDVFLNWRQELLTENNFSREMVREELLLRLRRMGQDAWEDLAEHAPPSIVPDHQSLTRSVYVEKMSRFIAAHAHETITVTDIAKSAGLSATYAMTLYKKVLGMTINQSLTRSRLDLAQSMLISTEKPITTIAMESGFGSISSFYEAFQQRFKAKPTEFRRSGLFGPILAEEGLAPLPA